MAETLEFSFARRGNKFDDPGRGLAEWARALDAGMAVAGRGMPADMRQHLAGVADALAARHGGKWPGSTGSASLSSRSGDLLRSLRAGVAVAGTGFADTRGSLAGAAYLRVHEYGGTVTPRGARFLAIPLPAALNPNGTPIKDDPRAWTNTFVQKSRAGNLLIFRRQGAGIVPLYALKSSVTLRPRLGARDLARERMPYLTSKVLDTVLAGLAA